MQVISVSASDRRSPRRMVSDRLNKRSDAGDLAAPSPPRRGAVCATLPGWMAIVASVIILVAPAPALARSTRGKTVVAAATRQARIPEAAAAVGTCRRWIRRQAAGVAPVRTGVEAMWAAAAAAPTAAAAALAASVLPRGVVVAALGAPAPRSAPPARPRSAPRPRVVAAGKAAMAPPGLSDSPSTRGGGGGGGGGGSGIIVDGANPGVALVVNSGVTVKRRRRGSRAAMRPATVARELPAAAAMAATASPSPTPTAPPSPTTVRFPPDPAARAGRRFPQ